MKAPPRAVRIIRTLFGAYKVSKGGAEVEVDCIFCADRGFSQDKGKNLGLNFAIWGYHCWRCEASGSLDNIMVRVAREKGISRALLPQRGTVRVQVEAQPDVVVTMPDGAQRIDTESGHGKRLLAYWTKRTGTKAPPPHLYEAPGRFPWRLVITVWKGETLTFWQARSVLPRPKFKDINPKASKDEVLYLPERAGRAVRIVEGVFDAECTPGGAAILGSAISRGQIELVKATGCRRIDVCLDGDAIRKGWTVARRFHASGWRGELNVMELPRVEDPGSIGKVGMERMLRERLVPYTELHWLESCLGERDADLLETPTHGGR